MIYEYGLTIGPSKIHIRSDKKEAIFEAIKEIKYHFKALEEYISRNPMFKYSLEPLDSDPGAPLIIRLMSEASRAAGVGPMASVAGAIADLGLRKMLEKGAKFAIVENGGEIAAYTGSRDIVVSIVTNNVSLSGRIGLLIEHEETPLGIATSTGIADRRTISFGIADSVTVTADNATIADAAATSICNAVIGSDPRKSISRGIEKAKSIKGVRGAMIFCGGYAGLFGKLPKIVRISEE